MLHICNIFNFDSGFENFPFAGQIELPLACRGQVEFREIVVLWK